jgi:hypothetical protein
MKKFVELFSGAGIVSKVMRVYGYQTVTVDIRSRRGVCVPDIRANMLDVTAAQIIERLGGNPFAVWCSMPCETFSYAAGNYHYKSGQAKSPAALAALDLLAHTLQLLRQFVATGAVYFIENPVGRLQHNAELLAFLEETGGRIETVHYSAYGHGYIKPTHIFTNCPTWQPRPKKEYGRAAKNPNGKRLADVSHITTQKIPVLLCHEVANALSQHQWQIERERERLGWPRRPVIGIWPEELFF